MLTEKDKQLCIFFAKYRYTRKKDDEFFKMSIGVRRDMEEKMKIERETLKKVLTDTNKRDVESAVDRTKVVSADNSFQYIFCDSYVYTVTKYFNKNMLILLLSLLYEQRHATVSCESFRNHGKTSKFGLIEILTFCKRNVIAYLKKLSRPHEHSSLTTSVFCNKKRQHLKEHKQK